MQLLPLNPPALLQFLFSFLLLASSVLFVLRAAASRYFAVDDDAAFEPENRGYGEFRRGGQPMSIGGRGDGNSQSGSSSGSGKCASCGKSGSKVCSRCKNVRYCSESCQSKHWRKNHKYVCRKKEFSSENALMSGHGEFKVLFPYDEFVRLYNWNKHVFPPCGLSNCGNSCFANVVLQCLACTRPLVAYLLEGTHSRQCRRNSWCVLCELQLHIERVTRNVQPFSPLNILTQLPNISSNLGYGRQEDAHEFMRYAIDTMQSVCLDEHGGEKALASSTQETTLIQHVFGGHLQSQVICTNCNMTSNRYENMMDLTVEIQGDAESLEECLDQFTVKEWLDGENKYKCDGCDDYVKAWKRLTVHQAPNILTIALKRFQSGRFGKLNKRVTFPETLELSPYMSNAGDKSNIYKLFAVVVHLDMLNASFFGHYICYTRDFGGNWYMIDDCKVIKVELEEVLSQGAYMLLYSRLNAREHKPLEIIKENVLLTNPLEVAVSDISKSFCSSDAAFQNGTPIKCNGIINIETRDVNVIGSASVEHDEQRFTSSDKYSSSSADSMDVDANGSHDCSLEENRSTDMPNGSLTVQQLTYSGNSAIHEAPTEQIPTSTERILSSKTDSMDVDANGSHDCALEENRSTDMSNGSLTVQQLTYSGNSKIHEAPTEQIPTSTERILSSKTDTVQTVVSNIFREADSLEQNVSLDMPGIQAKGSLYNGETTNAKAQVTSVSSSFLSLSKSGLAESDGFPESSLNQKAKVSAVASKSNTIFRTGSKTLFARGFLDKPLKKKSVSQSKDQLGDISFSQSTKKEARELPESSCAVSCEESNSLVWSDPAQKKAVDLNRFENGRAENQSNCPSMNNRSNGYSEPRPSHQISPQYPVHGNGKISSVAFDPRACLSNPSPVVNGTSMVIDGDDLTVEMSQTNPREQLLSVSEDLENGSSISGEISKDLPDISDPSLNEVPALCQKRSADGKCNTVEDDLSGKANGSSYQTSGVAQ